MGSRNDPSGGRHAERRGPLPGGWAPFRRAQRRNRPADGGLKPAEDDGRIAVGTSAIPFEPVPPRTSRYRPDTFFDGWSTDSLTVRVASVRGDHHRWYGQPRQDSAVVAAHEASGTVAFAVADGVSSSPKSHVGSQFACEFAVDSVLTWLSRGTAVDWEHVLRSVSDALDGVAGRIDGSGSARSVMSTTLVTGTVTSTADGELDVDMVQVGDSTAWLLLDDGFTPLLEHKDAGTPDVHSHQVRALPSLPTAIESMRFRLPGHGVLLVATDGVADPLGDGTGPLGACWPTFCALLRRPRAGAPPRLLQGDIRRRPHAARRMATADRDGSCSMTSPDAHRIDAGRLEKGQKLGAGGQGTVWALTRGRMNGWPVAYKEYSASVRTRLDSHALAAMVGFFRG